MRILLLFMAIFLSSACQTEYNKQTCTELSFKKYKGSPIAIKSFNENCQDIQIKYTSEHCQNALGMLIIHGEENKLIAQFGDKVMNCFTKYDLKKFLKDQP